MESFHLSRLFFFSGGITILVSIRCALSSNFILEVSLGYALVDNLPLLEADLSIHSSPNRLFEITTLSRSATLEIFL